MASRFRNELTRVPDVRINIDDGGLRTTIAWTASASTPVRPGSSASTSGAVTFARFGDPRQAGPLPTDRFLLPGTRQDFGTGSVSDMTSPGLASFKALLDATRQRQLEIVQDTSRAKWQLLGARAKQVAGWATLAAVVARPIRESVSRAVAVRQTEIAVLKDNLAASRISVDFDMSTEVAGPHRAMQDCFGHMIRSNMSWRITHQQGIDRVRARSMSGEVLARVVTSFRRHADPLVRTSEAPLAFEALGGRATAYVYPGFVLVISGAGCEFALIDLTEIEIKAGYMHFTETESVPGDSVLTAKVWAKSNRNGSRDRRFASNRELPVMEYGDLTITSPGGLNEHYMVSRPQPVLGFAAAATELKRILLRTRVSGTSPQQRLPAQRRMVNAPTVKPVGPGDRLAPRR